MIFKKWEYKETNFYYDDDKKKKRVFEIGNEGWECYCVTTNDKMTEQKFYWKRPYYLPFRTF